MLTFKVRQQRFAEAYNFSILPDPESFGSGTEHPEHPEHPPFAALPSWPEQSHVPRCMRRLTASTASATITKHIITVAGVISKGTIVEPPQSRCQGRLAIGEPPLACLRYLCKAHVLCALPTASDVRTRSPTQRSSLPRGSAGRSRRRISAWGARAGTAIRLVLPQPHRSIR